MDIFKLLKLINQEIKIKNSALILNDRINKSSLNQLKLLIINLLKPLINYEYKKFNSQSRTFIFNYSH